MKAKWILNRQSMLVGLLGATMLFGSPLSAQADQGKWWNPEGGSGRSRERQHAGPSRQPDRYQARGGSYRAPAWHNRGAYRQGPRYYRPWYGRPVYRERVWMRSGWGRYAQPVYGWRYYATPYYYYPRHIIYVSPVRFFISAGAVIGGVHIHGTYSDPGEVYGCNFCDAQFSSFHAYEDHVGHCPYAPDGYRVQVDDRDYDQLNDQDQGWDREDED